MRGFTNIIILGLTGLIALTAVAIGYVTQHQSELFGAPISNLQRSLVPESDNSYFIGTTSPSNLRFKALTLATTTSGCATFSDVGELFSKGVACGAGGGSGGGTWSTTTSQVVGQFVNYPNNDTDVVSIGANATTSAEFFFDPNVLKAVFRGSLSVNAGTSTINFLKMVDASSTNATTTNLTVTGNSIFGVTNALPWLDAGGSLRATTTPTAQTFYSTSVVGNRFPYASSTAISAVEASSTFGLHGTLGVGTTSPGFGGKAGIVGTTTINGYLLIGTSTLYQKPFVRAEVGCESGDGCDFQLVNRLSSPTAFAEYALLNDSSDTSDTHYGVLGINSSVYSNSAFGDFTNKAHAMYMVNQDGPILIQTSTTTASSTYIAFGTGGTNNERLRITSTGNVGIGTTSPFRLLSVAGPAVITGTTTSSVFVSTSTTATSTFANGIELTGGCLRINGACFAGGGTDTLNSKWATSTNPDTGIFQNSGGIVGIGTTTPRFLLQLSSSTAPQLNLTDGSLTSNQWNFRVKNSLLYIATSSPSTFATSTFAALSIDSTGPASLSIGSSSPNLSAVNGMLTLGANSTNSVNGSTTIQMGKIQFDGVNSANARVCAMVVGTAWVIINGPCVP